MQPIPSLSSAATLDQITSLLAYWTAAGTYAITALVLVLTVIMIRSPIKENTRARKHEEEQKRLENALELLKIVGGVKDRHPDGGPDAFLQLSCIEALSHFPEYHLVCVYMRDFYRELPKSDNNDHFVAATERLVARTRHAARSA
jgi:hypothetical protein